MQAVTTHLLALRLLSFIDNKIKSNPCLEILELNLAAGLDFVSAFFFGLSSSSNFLENEDVRKRWLSAYLKSHTHHDMLWIQEAPSITMWLEKVGMGILSQEGKDGMEELNSWCLEMCDASEKSLQVLKIEREDASGNFPAAYNQLKTAIRKEQQSYHTDQTSLRARQRLEIASELLDHLGTIPSPMLYYAQKTNFRL